MSCDPAVALSRLPPLCVPRPNLKSTNLMLYSINNIPNDNIFCETLLEGLPLFFSPIFFFVVGVFELLQTYLRIFNFL